jgi:hypothetical protein
MNHYLSVVHVLMIFSPLFLSVSSTSVFSQLIAFYYNFLLEVEKSGEV